MGRLFGTFSAVGRLVMWDVLRVGHFKSWTFSDGTFLEWDISRAGPFVCAPDFPWLHHTHPSFWLDSLSRGQGDGRWQGFAEVSCFQHILSLHNPSPYTLSYNQIIIPLRTSPCPISIHLVLHILPYYPFSELRTKLIFLPYSFYSTVSHSRTNPFSYGMLSLHYYYILVVCSPHLGKG
jgi:hypothetical protein